jgi:phage-related protein
MAHQNFKRKWSREEENSGDEENVKMIGSFSLKEVKSSTDYLRRIETSDAKKRKWALNFGYLGSKYQGLQMNPGRLYLGRHVFIERIVVSHLFVKKPRFT